MNLLTNFMAITGQQTWELLAWTMCYFLVAGTAVALAGALIRFLCKRLAPQIRYTASLAVFAILAALPFGIALWLSPSMSIPVVPTPIVIDLAHTPITMSPVEEPIKLTNIVIAEAQTPEVVPLVVAIARQNDTALVERLVERAIELLPWLWLIGTPLTFLLLATGLIGSNRLRRKCKQLTEGPIFDACQRLRSTLAISQRVGIAINEHIATPLLIGIVRPMILLPPAALTGWSPDELEMVLLHELAHVRRWDNLVNFGQRLVESLLFFHPAVWWVSRWVRRDREECCDAVVVARTAKPQAYAELLVALATPTPPLVGLALAQHPLAGRIRRILHLEEEKMLITRSTLGLVGFFVVAVLGVVLWQPTTATLAKESATEVAEQKVITTEDTESTEGFGAGRYGGAYSFQASSSSPARLITYELPEKDKGVLLNRLRRLERDIVEKNAPIPWSIREAKETIDLQATDHVHALIFQEIYDSSENTSDVTKVIERIRHGIKIAPQGPPHVYFHCFQSKEKRFRPVDSIRLMKHADGSISLVEAAIGQTKSANQLSPFPTLEAQRSADLAFKLLGLELEPLSEEELERVKKLGHESGLRVSQTVGMATQQLVPRNACLPGDLLVGLHVWPVNSLLGISEILQRDDLANLSPLKFYAVRPPGGGFGSGDDEGDQLVTGRIEVNISAMKKQAVGGVIIPPGVTLGQPSITQRHEDSIRFVPPINQRYKNSYQVVPTIGRIKPMLMIFVAPNTAPGQEMTRRINVVLNKLQGQVDAFLVDTGKNPELAKKYQVTTIPTCLLFHNDKQIGTFVGVHTAAQLEKLLTSSIKQLNLPQTPAPRKPHALASGDSVKVIVTGAYPDQPIDNDYTIESMGTLPLGPIYGRVKVAGLTLFEAEEAVKKQLLTMLKDVAVQITLVTKNGQHSNHGIRFGNQTQSESDETFLLYDNRTFSSWKSSWRRDLSIDLRTKAVRAFVAFANAGKGTEAVDEIMAIVAEYDWTALGINGVTDPLKRACVAAFAERQLPIDVAVEAVIAAKDSNSSRVRAFTPYVIGPLSRVNQDANKRLREAFPEMKLPTIEELRAKWRGLGGGSPAPTK